MNVTRTTDAIVVTLELNEAEAIIAFPQGMTQQVLNQRLTEALATAPLIGGKTIYVAEKREK